MKDKILLLLLAVSCTNPNQNTLSKVEINHKWVLIDQQKKVCYEVFPYDNGPDYPSEGLYRVIKDGKIGYADQTTNVVVIPPQYDCAFPFENGKAKVSNDCKSTQEGEHSIWTSDVWEFINKPSFK